MFGVSLKYGSEVVWFCCGEMGVFRLVSSEIFADECDGMTMHFYPDIRSIFSENIPPLPKNITLWLKGYILVSRC